MDEAAGLRQYLPWLLGIADVLAYPTAYALGADAGGTWPRAAVIDLGRRRPCAPAGLPGALAGCGGGSRGSRFYALPPHARGAVRARARDAALGPCEGVLESGLTTRRMAAH